MPPLFTQQTFDLLAGIAQTPTVGYYRDHREAFRQHVEQPLQGLVLRAGERLPALMRGRLETRRNLFSRFMKNDFGRGGAWASYWGAFYPRGSRRLADVQLAVWLNAQRLQISFYIGDYAREPRQRFLRNIARLRPRLTGPGGYLRPLLDDPRVQVSLPGRIFVDEEDNLVPELPLTWEEWLDDPAAAHFWARAAFHPRRVLTMPAAGLEDLVVRLHADYFPLALLAMEDDPEPLLTAWAEDADAENKSG